MSTYYGNPLTDDLTDSGYEYDNIQSKLDRMTQPELESDYGQRLADRAASIREDWRNGRGAYVEDAPVSR
jgi:hypothetical protein